MNSSPNKLLFIAQCTVPTKRGQMTIRAYRNAQDKTEPTAFFFHPIEANSEPFVRVHDACFTSETLGSMKCDCKEQLEMAMDHISIHGGLVIYLPQEGRGIGLANKIAAYAQQDAGFDTVDANTQIHQPIEARTYEDAVSILHDLNIDRIHLMTNNPFKLNALTALGITILSRKSVIAPNNPHSANYLTTKQSKMGHLLDFSTEP